jgi:peroxiredoxin
MSALELRVAIAVTLMAGAAGWYRWAASPVVAGPALAAVTAAADGWVGKAAPDFALRTLDQRIVRLADFHGKVVLLNFWATWCAPCRVEMPWLVDFQQRYRSQGLEVVGISVNDGEPDKVAEFVHAMQVNYTIALKDDAVTDAYGGVRFLPQTFFIGKDGMIIAQRYGIRSKEEFEQDVQQALGSGPPPS